MICCIYYRFNASCFAPRESMLTSLYGQRKMYILKEHFLMKIFGQIMLLEPSYCSKTVSCLNYLASSFHDHLKRVFNRFHQEVTKKSTATVVDLKKEI